MSIVCVAFIVIGWVFQPFFSRAQVVEEDPALMVERINQRYDDFFRRQRLLQEIDATREREAELIKLQRQKERQANELARQEYVKSRKKVIPDPRWEREWEEQQKAWIEQIKLAGRRYSQKKQYLEDVESKGRRIPGKIEYQIED